MSKPQGERKISIFLFYQKEGKFQLAVAPPGVNTHNPPQSQTQSPLILPKPSSSHCGYPESQQVSCSWSIRHFEPSVPPENSEGEKLMQLKRTFLAFLLSALLLSSPRIFSFILQLIWKRNRQPD